MLRRGFSSTEIIKTLRKIKGTNTIWFNETYCSSPEQVIAECIKLMDKELKDYKSLAQSLDNVTKQLSKIKADNGYNQVINDINEVVELEDGSVSFNGQTWHPSPSTAKIINETWNKSEVSFIQAVDVTDIPSSSNLLLDLKVAGKDNPSNSKALGDYPQIPTKSFKAKQCPDCSANLITNSKCDTCQECGWSKCK